MLHSALCIYLSMFVSELESLEKSQSLIHISSNGEIIDSNLPQFALRINDEQTSEGETLVLLEHPICPADGHALISQKRDLHVAQTSFLATLLAPGKMGEMRVSAAGYHLAVEGSKLCSTVIESNDLRWTNESEVQRVEEENHILSLEVIHADLLELSIDDSSASELGSWLLRLESHVFGKSRRNMV